MNAFKLSAPCLVAAFATAAFAARPGDQQPIGKINPAYAYENIRPAGYTFPIGAMDFLSNGDLVVATWTDPYRIMIVKNATGPKSGMSVSEFASGLSEVLGLKVVNDKIYLLQKDELTLLTDTDHDGKADDFKAVAYNWTKSTMEKEYAMSLVWDGHYFYSSYGDNTVNGGTAVDPVPPGRLNGVLRISMDGTVEPFAGGVRVPGGLEYAFGELWLTENQGGYRPSNPLFNVRFQRWYGRPVNPPSMFQPIAYREFPDNGPHQPLFSPAALWMPFKEAGGRSPGNPIAVKEGPYKNQFFIPDADQTYGGLSRVFVEKVKGEYQGANFHFSQGFENKLVYRAVYGPDGSIYCGANGANGSAWQRNTPTGLARLKLTGSVPFDMLAVRSTGANSFEVEFTKPLSAAAGSDIKGNLQVNKYWERPQETYGAGHALDRTTLTVNSAIVSNDRTRVAVTLSGVTLDWTYYFHWTNDAIADQSGNKLWGTEAWYTLNNFGPGEDPIATSVEEMKAGAAGPFTLARGSLGELRVQIDLPRNVPYTAQVSDLRGRLQAARSGIGGGEIDLPAAETGGMQVFTLKAGDRTFSRLIAR